MQLYINNNTYNIADGPDRILLWIIRDELGLTGTKFGCGQGICGSCTVHVDGVPTRACITMLSTIQDKKITTIEGLSIEEPDGTLKLHPVQQAFLDIQVPQCSWCMSGQMMTAAALIANNPTPTQEEIVEGMNKNYCRCGCYFRIKQAVSTAAELARSQA